MSELQQSGSGSGNGGTLRRVGHGLRSVGSELWAVGAQSMAYDLQRLRHFLQQPPRWFLITLVGGYLFAVLFVACAASGIFREQAIYLRSLMP